MTERAEDNPLEHLIELFVYAPIGMLYEYPEVLPRLIKKGRSQVQLAKFFGQMAARQRTTSIPGSAIAGAETAGAAGAQAADAVAKVAARLITELGAQVGLAPSDPDQGSPVADRRTRPASEPSATTNGTPTGRPSKGGDGGDGATQADSRPRRTARLPIAGYDDLTAKQIIGLLEDLTQDQLTRVRNHEAANRNRKTVLAKIDRLLP